MSAILCTNCRHNTYVGNPQISGWVSCDHPKTAAKRVQWESGDPAWVDMLTGDAKTTDVASHALTECPCFEAVTKEGADG